jgi:hypothetical protein
MESSRMNVLVARLGVLVPALIAMTIFLWRAPMDVLMRHLELITTLGLCSAGLFYAYMDVCANQPFGNATAALVPVFICLARMQWKVVMTVFITASKFGVEMALRPRTGADFAFEVASHGPIILGGLVLSYGAERVMRRNFIFAQQCGTEVPPPMVDKLHCRRCRRVFVPVRTAAIHVPSRTDVDGRGSVVRRIDVTLREPLMFHLAEHESQFQRAWYSVLWDTTLATLPIDSAGIIIGKVIGTAVLCLQVRC